MNDQVMWTEQRQVWALMVAGGVAVASAAIAGLSIAPAGFFHGYLAAFTLWTGASLGCAALLMLHHLVGGTWGWSIRPAARAAMWTLPAMAVLFVPLVFGLDALYPWTDPARVAESMALQHQRAYLNVPFVLARAGGYFLLWTIGAWLLHRWTPTGVIPDERDNYAQRTAAAGLIVYVLSMTLAGIDWLAALEAEWYSTIFGLIIIAGQALMAMALMIIVVTSPRLRRRTGTTLDRDTLQDLGNLLLMLVVLHAYLSFSQYFIIWNGNRLTTIDWYLTRFEGGWEAVAVTLIASHFALPFAVLLFRHVKRSRALLRSIAIWIVLARALESAWLVIPAAHGEQLAAIGTGIALLLGIGAVWLGVFGWSLGRASRQEVQP